MPGVSVKVTESCIGCGTCLNGVCFVNAIHIIDNKAEISEECRCCGRCVDICPQNAIKLIINNKEFVEETINQIDKIVDVT
jgi:ferredoxin